MKKILLGAMVSTVFAGGTLAGAPCHTFHGFYVGGALTYSKGDLTWKSGNSSVTFSSKGAGVNGFLGYGSTVYKGLYLGGELGFGYDGSRFQNKEYRASLPDGSTKTIIPKSTSKLTYNVVGRAGYVFSNFLPYAKVGYEGRSKINGDQSSLNRNGVLLGIGGDYAITKNILLRAEYTYNFGARKKIDDITVHTPTKTILLGAGYKF